MKKAIYILFSLIIILLLGLIIWFKLPFDYKYKAEINYGNSLVEKIEQYKIENKKLPEEGDWETIKELNFDFNELGTTSPEYVLINENEFELVFVEGFDPPYLFYNSKEEKWKYDFPSVPKRFLEN